MVKQHKHKAAASTGGQSSGQKQAQESTVFHQILAETGRNHAHSAGKFAVMAAGQGIQSYVRLHSKDRQELQAFDTLAVDPSPVATFLLVDSDSVDAAAAPICVMRMVRLLPLPRQEASADLQRRTLCAGTAALAS